MAVVSGISIYARVHEPGKFGDYFINLAVDQETAKRLKAEKVPLRKASDEALPDGKTEKDYGPFIARFKESEDHPPRVVNGNKEDIDDLIGNGSKVNVQYQVGEWNYKGKKGATAYLKAVQVVELVKYVPPAQELEFDVVEGSGSDDSDDLDLDDLDDDLEF